MTLDNIEQLEAKINRLIEKHELVKKEKETIEKSGIICKDKYGDTNGSVPNFAKSWTKLLTISQASISLKRGRINEKGTRCRDFRPEIYHQQ